MEALLASVIGLLSAVGIYLTLRLRTFPVILGLTFLSYAVNLDRKSTRLNSSHH